MAVIDNNHEPQLQVVDLSISFGGIQALNTVSLAVHKGEIYSIIGPNGAGKTTLFNCISGIYQAQEGSILFASSEIMGMKPHKIAQLGIARAFQNIELFRGMTVLDNLMSARGHAMRYGFLRAAVYLGKCSQEEVRCRDEVEEIIEFLDLQNLRKSPVGSLSYGLQKRVELGRALAMRPKLLLIDEPVSGMGHQSLPGRDATIGCPVIIDLDFVADFLITKTRKSDGKTGHHISQTACRKGPDVSKSRGHA
jgi:branched-chain amino acid transport system ATP-binding protein